jgi:hypothetical protein
MNAINIREWTDEEFSVVRQEIRDLVERVREHMQEIAARLARMSHVQFRKVQDDLRLMGISKDRSARWRLYGQGTIPRVFAEQERTLRAAQLRRLPERAVRELGDEDRTWPIVTPRGVAHKRIREMSGLELQQLVDPDTGPRSEAAQIRLLQQRMKRNLDAPPPPAAMPEDAEDPVAIYADDEYVYARLPGGSVRIPKRALRKFVD